MITTNVQQVINTYKCKMSAHLIYVLVTLSSICIISAQLSPTDFLPKDSECGVLRPDQFYNLETVVQPNEFPWLATLNNNNSSHIKCVAILISKQYILTVAHCLTREPPADTIELGSCETRDTGICFKIHTFETFIHPKFEPTQHQFEYDIALLRMEQPVLLSEYILPICLPTSSESNIDFSAQHLALTGLSYLTKKKGKLFLLIMGLPQCINFFQGLELTELAMCANTCDNGSKYLLGSALMGIRVKYSQPQQYYLVSLLTSGKGHDCDITPDIFRRIDRHMSWILSTISMAEQHHKEILKKQQEAKTHLRFPIVGLG